MTNLIVRWEKVSLKDEKLVNKKNLKIKGKDVINTYSWALLIIVETGIPSLGGNLTMQIKTLYKC